MDGGVDVSDDDGDSISNTHEDSRAAVDTDRDGTPDSRDEDSDGDGIADRDEAGDDDIATPPVDTDGDSSPDFRDLDSDGNGILDQDELRADTDGDGMADFQDLDDDNDRLTDDRDLNGERNPPVDGDGDGVPDFKDPDSDNDLILDGDEFGLDTDSDGDFDWYDTDSDNDGIPDLDEAGDSDLRTVPVDTDEDGVPDFRDADSDNDGLSDRDEFMNFGTNPRLEDSDGDMVSDLIEVGAGSNPTDPSDSPRTRGNFVFQVPYEQAPVPTKDTLSFRTSVQFADVYFLFDRSTSMRGEIDALRSAVNRIVSDLTCADSGVACMTDDACGMGEVCSPFSGTCIEDPGTSTCVASPWTGAGYYESTYDNRISLQANAMATANELARWNVSGGTERLYAAVQGVVDGSNARNCSMAMGRVGCPGYRDEAVKILVTFTDEDSDGGDLNSAAMALRRAGITMIGVWSGSPSSSEAGALRDLVRNSGSFRADGTTPLFYNGMDASVVGPVTQAINEIVEGVPLRVTITAENESGDAVRFIDQLVANTTGEGCSDVMTEDSDMDMVHETFPAVTPGTPVCWDVVPITNTIVPPTESPQVFVARLTVMGDGSPLDSRLVYFLVPPKIEGPGVLQ